MDTTLWIVAMWSAVIVGMLALRFLVDGLFWCFCWAFCKVDDQVQNWDYRNVTAEDVENLRKAFDYREAV